MNWLIEKLGGKPRETDREVIVRLMEERCDLNKKLSFSEQKRFRELYEIVDCVGVKDPELAQKFYQKYLYK